MLSQQKKHLQDLDFSSRKYKEYPLLRTVEFNLFNYT
jgi:hypothetical protein